MVEILKHPKEPLSHALGLPVIPETQGVTIGQNHFDAAVCLIGDGTGLEALKVARAKPRSAVVVLDPLARRFAGTLYSQLDSDEFHGIDWSFVTGDKQLRHSYQTLTDALARGDKAVERIEHEYRGLRPKIHDLRQSIFLADGSTHKTVADAPLFDDVNLTYPSGSLVLKEIPALFSFLNGALRDGGSFHVATDIFPLYEVMLMFTYPMVTEHGKVIRHGRVNQPLSLYDITNGASGYHYINMVKSKPFPEMSMLRFMFEDMQRSSAGLLVASGAFDGKKKDIKK